jgi:hypothetical protein
MTPLPRRRRNPGARLGGKFSRWLTPGETAQRRFSISLYVTGFVLGSQISISCPEPASSLSLLWLTEFECAKIWKGVSEPTRTFRTAAAMAVCWSVWVALETSEIVVDRLMPTRSGLRAVPVTGKATVLLIASWTVDSRLVEAAGVMA